MRFRFAVLIALVPLAATAADPPAKRFGVEANLKSFPQATPKEALASLLKAIDLKRPDYVVAHLADPQFVDRRIKETSYDDLLSETTAKLVTDPAAARQLRAYLDKGEWMADETTALARLKEGSDRTVSFRKIEGRWFLRQPFRPRPRPRERE